MATLQHSFIAATITAHRDALAALRAMPGLAWTVVAILAFQAVFDATLYQVIPKTSLLGRGIPSILYYALLTPFFIAVHRFVILGEVTRRYRLEWRDLRFQMFFGWAFVIFAMTKLSLSSGALPRHWMIQFLVFVAAAGICVVVTRIVILFPAIAVDAPGATPRNAFDDTKGHGWYIFFLLLFPFIPSAVVVALISALGIFLPPLVGRILLVPLLGLTVLVWLTLAVVLASRVYQNLGDRLNRTVSAGL